MRPVFGLRERLRAVFFREQEEKDLDEELRFHLEMETEVNLRRGMKPGEARRHARLTLGGVDQVKDGVRDARGLGLLENLIKDVRYAMRRLRREPAFSAALILTLALGIGGITAIFSVVDATLLRPLPFAHDERLVLLDHVEVGRLGSGDGPKLSTDFTDLDSLRHVFAQAGAYAVGGLNLTGAGEPIRADIALVTPGFFSTLGVQPAIGRPFTAAEGVENAPVAIVSNGLWRRHFGGDPDVIGRTIHLNDVRYEVVGVMPRGFAFPEETEIWLPLPIPMTFSGLEVFRMVVKPEVVARLAPGITVEQAGARLLALVMAYRPADRPLGATAAELVQPLRDSMMKSRRTALFILLGAAGLILLLACTNAANLLLSRAATRRREIALRAALGATSGRILWQLLAESVVIAGAAGVLGVIIAFVSTGVLTALVPSGLLSLARPAVDGRVLLFAAGVTLASGIAAALWPALHAGRADAGSALKCGARAGATARDATPLRRLFIVGELSLALVLLVGAGIMLRSFQAVLAVDPGMRPERVATLELALARATYGGAAARRQFYADVLERLHAAPDVEAAAAVNELPMRGDVTVSFTVSVEGKPRAEGKDVDAQYLRVTPEYFRVLGIPLLLGRPARDDPDPFGQNKEVVVNLELARRLWPGESPIGKRLLEPQGPRTVVGVVGNVRAHSLDRDLVLTQMYLPFAEASTSNAALLVRGQGRPEALSARLQEAVRTVDPTQAVYNVRSMEQVIARTIAPRRTTTLLVTAFGVLGVVLAAVGVYGVVSLGVVQRRAEIGIRMALGARPSDVLRMIISEGLLLALAGIAIGLGCAWFLSKMLETLVYGIAPRDPLTFMAAPLFLLGIAVIAAWIPARSAARADPLQSLRTE